MKPSLEHAPGSILAAFLLVLTGGCHQAADIVFASLDLAAAIVNAAT